MQPNGSSMPQITDPFVHLTNRTVQRRSGAQKIGKKKIWEGFGFCDKTTYWDTSTILSYTDTKQIEW